MTNVYITHSSLRYTETGQASDQIGRVTKLLAPTIYKKSGEKRSHLAVGECKRKLSFSVGFLDRWSDRTSRYLSQLTFDWGTFLRISIGFLMFIAPTDADRRTLWIIVRR